MSFVLHEQLYRDLARVAGRKVTVCGAGALGANLTETLARMGLRHLRVIDRDRVEPHNLSTQPWTQQDVGVPKVRALATALYRAVGARVESQHVELLPQNALNLLQGSEVVVDAFDNRSSRLAVAEACGELQVPCLHIALAESGDYGCGLWNDSYPAMTGDRFHAATDRCDYPLTRPLVLLVAAAAGEALVCYLLDGKCRGFDLTLRDLRMTSVNTV